MHIYSELEIVPSQMAGEMPGRGLGRCRGEGWGEAGERAGERPGRALRAGERPGAKVDKPCFAVFPPLRVFRFSGKMCKPPHRLLVSQGKFAKPRTNQPDVCGGVPYRDAHM